MVQISFFGDLKNYHKFFSILINQENVKLKIKTFNDIKSDKLDYREYNEEIFYEGVTIDEMIEIIENNDGYSNYTVCNESIENCSDTLLECVYETFYIDAFFCFNTSDSIENYFFKKKPKKILDKIKNIIKESTNQEKYSNEEILEEALKRKEAFEIIEKLGIELELIECFKNNKILEKAKVDKLKKELEETKNYYLELLVIKIELFEIVELEKKLDWKNQKKYMEIAKKYFKIYQRLRKSDLMFYIVKFENYMTETVLRKNFYYYIKAISFYREAIKEIKNDDQAIEFKNTISNYYGCVNCDRIFTLNNIFQIFFKFKNEINLDIAKKAIKYYSEFLKLKGYLKDKVVDDFETAIFLPKENLLRKVDIQGNDNRVYLYGNEVVSLKYDHIDLSDYKIGKTYVIKYKNKGDNEAVNIYFGTLIYRDKEKKIFENENCPFMKKLSTNDEAKENFIIIGIVKELIFKGNNPKSLSDEGYTIFG